MGIEDHIRDIVREKVNERVGQEMSIAKRGVPQLVRREVNERLRYEIKRAVGGHEHEYHVIPDGVELREGPEEYNPDRFNRHDPHRRRNSPWCEDEDYELNKEIRREIGNIAKRHCRTTGAIISRLRQNAEKLGGRSLV